jgi:hypothetical protein
LETAQYQNESSHVILDCILEQQRRGAIKVEKEGHLNDLVVISFLLSCFVLFDDFLVLGSFSQKNGFVGVMSNLLNLKLFRGYIVNLLMLSEILSFPPKKEFFFREYAKSVPYLYRR